MAKDTTFDRIQQQLFSDTESAAVVLSDKEIVIKTRYQATFVHWLENPQRTDKQMVEYLVQNYDIEKSQAYLDIPRIKLMLGNVQNAAKEWHRYTVLEMLRKSYQLAEQQADPNAMTRAADKIGKYTRLDQVEIEALPWNKMIPPNFEPSSDITILDIEADPNLEKNLIRMKKKYLDEVIEAEYVEYD